LQLVTEKDQLRTNHDVGSKSKTYSANDADG